MSHSYNLLIESSDEVEVLTEQTDHGKQLYIEGIFAQAEKVNGNRRMYARGIMEGALDRYVRDYVSKRRALGELNHPDYPVPDPDKAAVRITEMKWSGNNVYGKALVLNTPKGQTVRGLLEGGFAMGVSTRGLGSLVEDRQGIRHVQDDYMMTAVDCVDNPSGPDCYVDAITESTRWMISESTGMWVPIVEQNASQDVNQELFLERLTTFLKGHRK